ncbi:MAG: SDR family oxidoreductase [Chloroflexi bacterium]|jgi:UDP-glucose 4-epimerase|nr:SDR family oxidoreductase [Chloroflexota bacterium]
MEDQEVILVTGVAGYWGRKVAARLIELDGNRHVIGLDVEAPDPEVKDLDFIQADIRNPLLVDLLRAERVSTVCHLVFVDSVRPGEATFDINVMGTIKVIGACAEAGVRKVVLKSSTAVYGACPANPAFLTEQHPLRGSRSYGYTRDMVEIESFCNGFRRQYPQLIQTILRFSSIVGPNVDTPMTRFLRESWTPILLGFDPMMQIIHEQDVVDALVHAVFNDVPGVFNVAALDAMPLTRIMALAGKLPVPVFHLFAYWGAAALGSSGLRLTRYVPIELDYIRYPWVADLTRMQEEMGFMPRYTAEETLREFAGHQRVRRFRPDALSLAYDEERLRDTLERRMRMRASQNGGNLEQQEQKAHG